MASSSLPVRPSKPGKIGRGQYTNKIDDKKGHSATAAAQVLSQQCVHVKHPRPLSQRAAAPLSGPGAGGGQDLHQHVCVGSLPEVQLQQSSQQRRQKSMAALAIVGARAGKRRAGESMCICQFHDQALRDGAGRQRASRPGRAQCTSACASVSTGCARPSAGERGPARPPLTPHARTATSAQPPPSFIPRLQTCQGHKCPHTWHPLTCASLATPGRSGCSAAPGEASLLPWGNARSHSAVSSPSCPASIWWFTREQVIGRDAD